jgi:mannose-6-phosphate isomerase class I
MLAPAGSAVPMGDGFSVLVVLEGSGELRTAGEITTLTGGQVYAIPAGLCAGEVVGSVHAVQVRPGTEPAAVGVSR